MQHTKMTKKFIRQLLSYICKLVIGDWPRTQGFPQCPPAMQQWEMLTIHICINQYCLRGMTWGTSAPQTACADCSRRITEPKNLQLTPLPQRSCIHRGTATLVSQCPDCLLTFWSELSVTTLQMGWRKSSCHVEGDILHLRYRTSEACCFEVLKLDKIHCS